MKSNRKRKLSAMIVAVVFAIVALTSWRMNRAPTENLFPALPNPNGYAALLQGAKQLRGDPPTGPNATPTAIQQYVGDNRAVVEASRHALTLPSAVPVQFSLAYTSVDNIGYFKKLSQAFHVSAEAALLRTNLNSAISHWTDSIVLGQKSAFGGLAVDALAAASLQRKALRDLRKQFPSLNEPQLRKVVVALDSTIRQEEAPEQVLLREKEWARRSHGFLPRLSVAIRNFISAIQGKPIPMNRMHQLLREKDSLLRLTLIEAALQLYRQKNDSFPQSLAELKTFLPTLPPDPFSGKSFTYRPEAGDYRLYSVGPDGVDDGGKLYAHRSKETVPKGDFAFDREGN